MMNAWMPYPVAVGWTVIFAMVAVVHLGHAAVMGWRHRLWHCGHVFMALGMIAMFWPATPLLGMPAAAGTWVFGVVAGLSVLILAIAWQRGVRLGPLWLVSVLDAAAMAYMFAMMSDRLAWLSVWAAAWFTALTIGWASGWLGAVLERGGLGEPHPVIRSVPGTMAASAQQDDYYAQSWPSEAGTALPELAAPARFESAASADTQPAGAVTGVSHAITAARRTIIDGGRHDWSVRITLTAMAAGMGYMMLAMQFGMAPMGMTSAM